MKTIKDLKREFLTNWNIDPKSKTITLTKTKNNIPIHTLNKIPFVFIGKNNKYPLNIAYSALQNWLDKTENIPFEDIIYWEGKGTIANPVRYILQNDWKIAKGSLKFLYPQNNEILLSEKQDIILAGWRRELIRKTFWRIVQLLPKILEVWLNNQTPTSPPPHPKPHPPYRA